MWPLLRQSCRSAVLMFTSQRSLSKNPFSTFSPFDELRLLHASEMPWAGLSSDRVKPVPTRDAQGLLVRVLEIVGLIWEVRKALSLVGCSGVLAARPSINKTREKGLPSVPRLHSFPYLSVLSQFPKIKPCTAGHWRNLILLCV